MVNNSTNINNYISHQIIEHRKEPNHMTLEIQVLTWSMHTCGNRKCIIHIVKSVIPHYRWKLLIGGIGKLDLIENDIAM